MFVPLSGCAWDRLNKAEERIAIGTVTVSTPLFTPIRSSAVEPGKRLDFGDLKKEANIAQALQRPQVGISTIDYDSLAVSLAVKASGPQVGMTDSVTQSLANGVFQQQQSKEKTKTFQSPGVPPLPEPAAVPQPVSDQLLDLLKRSGQVYQLSQDEIATLVAAYKTYMVNLEDYYNVEGLAKSAEGILPSDPNNLDRWLPYKVHFTVTADPGWYARLHQFEAVTELEFVTKGDGFRLLTVSPLETAQTVEEFHGALTALLLSASAEAAWYNVAGQAAAQRAKAAAQRLEGLRSQTTLSVSYPAENKVRIRFRPAILPNNDGQELQPTSRILCATVLVRASAGLDSEQLKPVVTARSAHVQTPELVSEAKAVARSGLLGEEGAEAVVKLKAFYVPSLVLKPSSGLWSLFFGPSKSEEPGLWEKKEYDQVFDEDLANKNAWIPVWRQPKETYVGVENTFGYYYNVDIPLTPDELLARQATPASSSVNVDQFKEEDVDPKQAKTSKDITRTVTTTKATEAKEKPVKVVSTAVIGVRITNVQPTDQIEFKVPGTTWVAQSDQMLAAWAAQNPQRHFTRDAVLVVTLPAPVTSGVNAHLFVKAIVTTAASAGKGDERFEKGMQTEIVKEVELEPQGKAPVPLPGSATVTIDGKGVQLTNVPLASLTPEMVTALLGAKPASSDAKAPTAATPGATATATVAAAAAAGPGANGNVKTGTGEPGAPGSPGAPVPPKDPQK
jgi:hypothetical protein